MDQLHKNIAVAEKYCQEKGERLTKKRKIVLMALLQSQKAISAYELVDYCKTAFDENVPAMSVYRILDFFKELGLAHKLSLANKYVACSHVVCEHKYELLQFLICDQCQRVEEVNIDAATVNNLQAAINKAGFQLNSPQLEINGICQQCLATTENNDSSLHA